MTSKWRQDSAEHADGAAQQRCTGHVAMLGVPRHVLEDGAMVHHQGDYASSCCVWPKPHLGVPTWGLCVSVPGAQCVVAAATACACVAVLLWSVCSSGGHSVLQLMAALLVALLVCRQAVYVHDTCESLLLGYSFGITVSKKHVCAAVW